MCDAPLELGARFCSRCGLPLTEKRPAAAPAKGRWYHNIWVVLFLLLFVLGPFVLPLVWKNPRLSQTTKRVLTAVALGYVVVMGALIRQMLTAVLSSFEAYNSALTSPF